MVVCNRHDLSLHKILHAVNQRQNTLWSLTSLALECPPHGMSCSCFKLMVLEGTLQGIGG